jgi:molybdate transport system ATP-binding protein
MGASQAASADVSDSEILHACLTRRVHPGLTVDVELTLGPECGVVFGPSGAGKTTLLNLIAGLARPSSGFIRLEGRTLFDAKRRIELPLRSRRVGLIFQNDLLFPHLTVRENIRFGLRGWPETEASARLAEVAGLCEVESLLGRRPETLSGGERQRVGLARALAPRPRLLLCDEPVSALDLESRYALVERLRAVQRSEQIPLLYVTHAPQEAISLGSRLFLLIGGNIVARGAPLDVLTSPKQWPVARLSGVQNVFRATIENHSSEGGETHLHLADGPELVVPFNGRPIGSVLTVGIRSDDILLARGATDALSARNILSGTIERIVAHGPEAEVLVRTGTIVWVVSVVAAAVSSLALGQGAEVKLVIKARSCHVLAGESPGC